MPKSQNDPKVETARILLTGGLGDIYALESMWSDDERDELKYIHWATRSSKFAMPLFERSKRYAKVKHAVYPVQQTYYDLSGLKKHYQVHPEVRDWSISRRFREFYQRPFNRSTFLTEEPASLHGFDLPDRFVLIQHQTTLSADAQQRKLRDLDQAEWDLICRRLEAEDLCAVVVNSPDTDAPPDHPRVFNLVGKTTVAETIALLRRAEGYWGIASSTCVLASQLFDADHLWVKGPELWLKVNRHIYFAPHISFHFVMDHLTHSLARPIDIDMAQIMMKTTRIMNSNIVMAGSVVEVSKDRAAEFVRSGEAEHYDPVKLNEARMKFETRKATKFHKETN